ncbi:hypothetical protein FSP39_018006 [Pinctada imbricata]|uniref:Uncharacterized protein n=1 Tax=Pinctada imbricata TaxID=66713 RepID=A0AA89C611_PINIB|nr:hypothetical protein FSP39_018006 [Pinctada imbricata]
METFSYGRIPTLNILGINSFEANSEEKNFLPSIETAVSQFSTLGEKRRGNSAKRISVSLPSPGGKEENEQIRMRYTHGVKDDQLRMSGDHFQKMTLQYHDFGMDSVDVVFDVNQPSNILREQKCERNKSTMTRSLLDPGKNSNLKISNKFRAKEIRPISGLEIRKATLSPIAPAKRLSSPVHITSPRHNPPNHFVREDQPRSKSAISSSESDLQKNTDTEFALISKEEIDDMCSEEFLKIDINLDDLINESKESANTIEAQHASPTQRKRKRRIKHHKMKTHDESSFPTPVSLVQNGNVSPDIHRNVYIRALQDARAKYFRRVHPGLTTTQAYKFSYFDVCSKIEEHKERYRREKDFRNFVGMKRIFGDIRLDDYYNPMARYGVNNYRILP